MFTYPNTIWSPICTLPDHAAGRACRYQQWPVVNQLAEHFSSSEIENILAFSKAVGTAFVTVSSEQRIHVHPVPPSSSSTLLPISVV
jgi:hypothetical protein